MEITFPNMTSIRGCELSYLGKDQNDLEEECGRAAAWRKRVINGGDKKGIHYYQSRRDSRCRNYCNSTVWCFHLPALEQGDGALVIWTARVWMKLFVQWLRLRHCEKEQELDKKQEGDHPPAGYPSVAPLLLFQLLQGRFSSAETTQTYNPLLCKPLAYPSLPGLNKLCFSAAS